MTSSERLARVYAMYPQLGTKINGQVPMAAALEAWSNGECITKITARDLAEDAKCEEK